MGELLQFLPKVLHDFLGCEICNAWLDFQDSDKETVSKCHCAPPDVSIGADRKYARRSRGERVSTPLFANEQEMVDSIVSAARELGWLVHHDRPARTDKGYRTALQGDAGFPDLMLTKHGRLWFIECKMLGNKPSPAQKKWLDWLELIPGVDVMVLYPQGYDALINWLARDSWEPPMTGSITVSDNARTRIGIRRGEGDA